VRALQAETRSARIKQIIEVCCWYFCETLSEFAAQIEQTHAESPRWTAEYRAAIGYFKAVKAARIPD
jgi:hypothetical protein